METRLYIFIGLMTLIILMFERYQHMKTRKEEQEVKTRLAWIMKRQINFLKIFTKGGKNEKHSKA